MIPLEQNLLIQQILYTSFREIHLLLIVAFLSSPFLFLFHLQASHCRFAVQNAFLNVLFGPVLKQYLMLLAFLLLTFHVNLLALCSIPSQMRF